jgi:hypothetical protein
MVSKTDRISLFLLRILVKEFTKTMKLVRSDTSEVTHIIAAAGARASRNSYTLVFTCIANVLALLITLTACLSVSVRAAALLSVPVFLAFNGYVVWRAVSSRQRWVIAGCTQRIYVRLFAWRCGNSYDVNEPDILVLETSEIASMYVRTLEVFLDGLKPIIVEWLVIEPAQAVAKEISKHIRPLLEPLGPDKAMLVANDEGRFTIEWKWWRPALRIFLQQVVQECSSVVIAPEERSELDLNGIWRGISRNMRKNPKDLTAQECQNLVHAMRLGFGCECAGLLSRYKWITIREASEFLAEIVRDEVGCSTLEPPLS